LSKVVTTEGMCLFFPNYFQHKVNPYELIDKTQVGHRTIVVLFFVSPVKKIPTMNNIDNSMINETDAKLYRELLMFSRKYEADDQNKFFERSFSLCEH
jgi:hypothetical protein